MAPPTKFAVMYAVVTRLAFPAECLDRALAENVLPLCTEVETDEAFGNPGARTGTQPTSSPAREPNA
jgi:hypothetical protein